jgi:pantoate--beta-alanine ligase
MALIFIYFVALQPELQIDLLNISEMKTILRINELKASLAGERRAGKSIGLVPTMGALHDGHLSLVKRCKEENDLCVVSIFVNPAQFNDRNDLATYPRMLDKDCERLAQCSCDYVFAPSEEEMYPEPDVRVFELGRVAEGMEGERRPGHFNGVAQIVSKLFALVAPDCAYFGEKDFQQIAVVREMARQLRLRVRIVSCPVVREKDGLAMSSRNQRLTREERQTAPAIARTLTESRSIAAEKNVREVEEWVVDTLNRFPLLRVEYYEIIDGKTLLPAESWDDTNEPVGCIAVFCGNVRLIDNIKY